MTLVERLIERSEDCQQSLDRDVMLDAVLSIQEQAVRIADLKMALLLVVRANSNWSMPLSTQEEITVDRIIADAESN